MEEGLFWQVRHESGCTGLHLVGREGRAFSEAGESSLRGFLDWNRILADENARMVEVPVPETMRRGADLYDPCRQGQGIPVVINDGPGIQDTGQGEQVNI